MADWFVKLQNALPQHGLSRAIGKLGSSKNDFIKRTFIGQFARAYKVNMAEAERSHLGDYESFNDFFTRALKPGARTISQRPDAVVCPADGAISQLGSIQGDTLLQAKGHRYSLTGLAGSLSAGFADGEFITVYLAPKDYHRVHLPFAATLTHTLAIPGALFSVNQSTEADIEGLFCRNERLVCRFDTAFGPMLVVFVGAMIVASIETVWPEQTSPYRQEVLTTHDQTPISFAKGDEIGRFLLGSTVVCCFPPGAVKLKKELRAGTGVRMGEPLGSVIQ